MIKPLSIAATLLLAGCATPPPSGPSMLVLPGSNKSFDQFRFDEQDCRSYAHGSVGGKTTEQAATDSAVKSAVVGTAIGTVAGAALGGHQGAAVGAGIGLLGGSVVGADTSYASAGSVQRRYDNAYVQCMYSKGHKVPVAGRFESRGVSQPVPPQAARTPPPPPPPAPQSAAPQPAPQAARPTPPPPPPGQPPAEAPADYKPQ